MENWIILNKLMILVYVALQFAAGGFQQGTGFVLFFLFYISLNITIYLIKKDIYQKILLGISIVFLIGFAKYLNGLLILLLPVNIFEFVFGYTQSPWLPAGIVAIPLLWLDRMMTNQYILVSSLSLILGLLVNKSWQRIQILIRENDGLREKIHSLSGKLNKDREYERQLKYSSQLEERNKIAQEIHDKIGHVLSGSLLQLEAAGMYLEKDRQRSGEIIQNVIHILRTGMDNIRVTLKNIKPPSEQMGLNRVKLTLEEFNINHHIKTFLLHQGNLERISRIQWKIMDDNIKEALTNTLKHSGATTVTVNIEVLNKYVKTEVKDNGVGASLIKKGLGIGGMEERSGNIGGKMIIDGSKGFSIITLLPFEEL